MHVGICFINGNKAYPIYYDTKIICDSGPVSWFVDKAILKQPQDGDVK